MKSEYEGNINNIRAVEDCIRATKKYTVGIGSLRSKHPVQGNGFTSKVFSMHYEVYPDVNLSWDMPAGKALDWLWGEYDCLDVRFTYNYPTNKAWVAIRDGTTGVKVLAKAIPGFSDALARVIASRSLTNNVKAS